MKINILLLVFCVTGCFIKTTGGGDSRKILTEAVSGDSSNSGRFSAQIAVSQMGGFQILRVVHDDEVILNIADVTGYSWRANGEMLVFSASPIYGNAGVFVFDPAKRKVIQIVFPKYGQVSDGGEKYFSDWFRLIRVDGDTVYYEYAPNVDSANFEKEKISKTIDISSY